MVIFWPTARRTVFCAREHAVLLELLLASRHDEELAAVMQQLSVQRLDARVGQVDLARRSPAQPQYFAGYRTVDPGLGLRGVRIDVFDKLAADHGLPTSR